MQTLPNILTANTYYWSPSSNASSRRRNEERHLSTVAAFLQNLGFATTTGSNSVTAEKDNIKVYFSYRESCKNVYKSLTVTRSGKRSNVTALKKLLA